MAAADSSSVASAVYNPLAVLPAYGNSAAYYGQPAVAQSATTAPSISTSTTTYQAQGYAAGSATSYNQVGLGGAASSVEYATVATALSTQVTAATSNPSSVSAIANNAAVTASGVLGSSAGTTASTETSSRGAAGQDTADNLTYIGLPDANGEYVKYPIPDVSTYQFDSTTNYYYDPSTGLYYDANSQYYYNSRTQQFLYWDSEKQSYVVAPGSVQGGGDDSDSTPGGSQVTISADPQMASQQELGSVLGDGSSQPVKKTKEKDKQDKVKIAKKIAKDMEKWAKTLNQKKENAKQGIVANQALAPDSLAKQPATADAGFAILEKKSTLIERQAAVMEAMRKKELDDKKSGPAKGKDGLVAAYGGNSDTDEDGDGGEGGGGVLDENRLTDWQKLACLLCKRQFPSKEALVRHQQLSDLHKQNLETLRASTGQQGGGGGDQESKYRDRAKERREKYGEPDVPPASKLKEKFTKQRNATYEEPTKHGIDSTNIGNKMLKAMGWNEGQGLGKANQGRTQLVEAQRRVATAGLGLRGSTYGASAGDSYKDTVKKMMQTRYNEVG